MGKTESTQLQTALAQYTSTTQYFRMGQRQLITDGAKYLAESIGTFWTMDTAANYLSKPEIFDAKRDIQLKYFRSILQTWLADELARISISKIIVFAISMMARV